MQIFFCGAAHEVTGSCHYVEACGKKFLVDCGMEQGMNLYENAELPVLPGEIDFVLLTHAHIDHSGMLPLLYKRGFRGPVYTTKATRDLCEIMLLDSAHIQEFEAQWRSKKGKRKGLPDVEPVYTTEDAAGILQQFAGADYGQTIVPAEGIRVIFTDVGHLLGSAAITVAITENGEEHTIVFSGDVGNTDQPLIRDPQPVWGCDTLVIESTYGDRLHEGRVPYIPRLVSILQDTFTRGGNVIIPSFAVGRTQEMLYFFRQIKLDNLLPDFPDFEVYVDSPLAVNATTVFQKNIYSCFDDEALALVRAGINPLQFPGLKLSVTSDDSKAINFNENPKVIISASGMCDAGRIKHHLKYNLWRTDSTILFVGYQSANTVGRAIADGAESVKIFGEEIRVLAKIEKLSGISGHADQAGLLHWVSQMEQLPSRVYVVHGEDQVTDRFAALLTETFGMHAEAPYSGDAFDLATGAQLAEGTREKTEKYKKKLSGKAAGTVREKVSAAYEALAAAGQRLLRVIERSRGARTRICAGLRTRSTDSATNTTNNGFRSGKRRRKIMAGSSFGTLFRITTWGESHGAGIGCTVDGVPAGFPLAAEDIQTYLDRRRPGGSKFATPRKESDTVEILSGVFGGKTTGTPIALIIRNENQHSKDYSDLADKYRPGHADYGYDVKYGFRDYRGGGRSSGRETAGRVAGGAVAALILKSLGITFCTYTKQIGKIAADPARFDADYILQNDLYMPDPETYEKAAAYLETCREETDSSGGIAECIISGVPAGLGDPVFEKLDANLAKAIFSIGAVKGFEIGSGFAAAEKKGSENNDPFGTDAEGRIGTLTNHCGGILGGISTGGDIVLRAAFKPTPSIALAQQTVDKAGRPVTLSIHGRHDPVIVPRAVVVVECMAACVILDAYLMSRTARTDQLG